MKNPTGSSPCLRRLADARWLLLLLAAFVVATARAVTVTAFDPNTWPRTDTALGVSGFTVEDFEDTTLVPGLQVQLSGGTNDYGPTSTLPKTWDPSSPLDDPNIGQQVLAAGVWDGSRVLLNRKTAAPVAYADGEWADLTFVFTQGASSVGFSVQQLEVAGTTMTVTTSTGVTNFNLSNVANFSVGGARNGYLRIDGTGGERILSVKIDNLGGDGFAFDHLAFSPATNLVQWTPGAGGNGHYYQVVAAPGGISWEDAQAAARARGGYLATCLSAAENTFVFNLVNDATYWFNDAANNAQGPWLGGFQPANSSEPAGGWQWMNNEGLFGFTNWSPGEPNNTSGTEHRLQFFGAGLNNRQPTWNDTSPKPYALVRGYVVEFDSLNGLRPIAHWKFDEASGAVARDSAGSFNGGLAGGAAFVGGGISGNAISLAEATNSFVNVGTSFPGFLAGDFTLVAWVKTTSTATDDIIVGKHNAGSPNGYFLINNHLTGGGTTGKVSSYASDAATRPTSTTTVTDGQWHQVVSVYRAGGTHSIYVDGSPAEASVASTAMIANTSAFVIGGVGQTSGNGTPSGGFTGLIDDVQVYDAALTDAQIDFLFANPGQEFQPAIYDLKTDWSDAMNPNCTWTYRGGSTALPHTTTAGTGDFSSPQPAWAPSSGSLPAWFKSIGVENLVHDWQTGDVVVHTQDDANGAGQGAANVIWTSPINDTVTISGGVWEGRDIGRGNDWFLYKNNTLLSQGHVESGDAFSRANPFLFSAGSGGAVAVTNIAVVVGDVIKLELVRTSGFGDYVGVNMTITGSKLAAAPDVTTNAATNVTGATATLGGAVNPNGSETSVYFEYGTTTSYGSTTTPQNIGCDNSDVAASANLTGLTLGAIYHFRAVAVTSGGTFYGEDATFGAIPRPIAHYKFDEASGTTAEDSAGSFDGTLSATGASLGATGISGKAVSLNRANGGFVNMGASFPGFTSGDFSLVVWVNTTTTEVDTLVLGKHEAFVTNGYLLPINPTGGGGAANKATFYASDAQVAQSPISTTTANDGSWHQIVGVYRAGTIHSVFVDGAPAEASTASQAIVANTAPFLVGGVNVAGTPQPRYTGLVDDVQVYDFALTDALIGFLFGHPGLEAPDFNRVLFRDDFNGSIDPAWTIVRPDAAYRTINPTELDLRASSGDLYTTNNNAKNVFLVTTPTSGDFTVTVRLNSFAPPNTNNAQIDLLAFDDDDNHVRANYGFIGGQRQIEFGKEVAASPSFQATPLDLGSGAFFMRLTKVGTTYTQSYSTDGVSFTTVNSPLTYGDGTPAKLGFVVDADPTESSHAFIDFFAIESLVPPTVTTDAASNVTSTSATLNGTVNPNSASTTYFFQYGPDTNYGSTTATQSAGGGPNPVAVSAAISGLVPNATVHFRLVANSSGSTFNGADAMFTTPALPPTVTTGAATDVRVHRATLNGTLDPQGTATTYYFEFGPDTDYGSVTPTVNVGTTAGPVSATITGLDGAATVHFRLVGLRGATTFPGSDAMFTTLTPGISAVAARGNFAPDANGDPTSATFFSFGPPAIGDAGHLAFRGTLTKNVGAVTPVNDTGIWAESSAGLRLIAQEGGVAADTLANFASFGDPVFASGAHIAFLAKLKPRTGDATAANASGIWSDVSGTLKLIARQGAPAPGAGSATFASFTSLGLADAAGPVFIAKLKGASPATDVGIWGANTAGVVQPVLVREGGQLDVGGGQMKTVATLQFLPVMKVVNGQTRGFNAAGALAFRATFTDKSFAIYKIVGGVVTLLSAKGADAPPMDATFATIGQPAISAANDAAFLGTMTIGAGGVTRADDAAIFAHVGGVDPKALAREGQTAPTLAAKFASFSDPVANAAGEVAFLTKLKPGTGDATPANASAIFANVGGALTLVARQGKPAPDGVNLFSKFSAFALPDFGGPVFLGKLKRSRTVSAKNDTGIWAADDTNTLSLVVRTESQLTVGPGPKTVKLLQFLPAVRGVPGQTRSFNRDGYLTFRAVFTDRTEAIFRVLR